MIRQLCIGFCLALVTGAIPSRAGNVSNAGTVRESKVVWTNDELDRLHDLGLISIVGREDDEKPASAPTPVHYLRTQDPDWYAAQAAILRGELEYRQVQLHEYQKALEDARSLRESTGSVDLVGKDFAITPEGGIEILQRRVNETQSELDALDDLARRNDIEPGTLRGQ
jgi:hypothetical protein